MFVLKSTLEAVIKEKNEKIDNLTLEIKKIKQDLEHELKMEKMKRDEYIIKFKEEMQEKLIKSDLLRNEAIAKLEIYEKLDTKSDANCIKETLNKLIEALSKTKDIQIIK